MMHGWQHWGVLEIVGQDGRVLASSSIDGRGEPDLGAVDAVARAMLTAKHLGARAVLTTPSTFLLQLLELSGLRVEVKGQPESRENVGRVDEAMDPGDPAA